MNSSFIERRPAPEHLPSALSGLHPVLARIYASRGINTPDELGRQLKELLPDSAMHGMDAAVTRLVRALQQREARIIAFT